MTLDSDTLLSVGALLVSIAGFVVALISMNRTQRLARELRPRLSVTGFLTWSKSGDRGSTPMWDMPLTIRNLGNSPVTIESAGWEVGEKRYLVGATSWKFPMRIEALDTINLDLKVSTEMTRYEGSTAQPVIRFVSPHGLDRKTKNAQIELAVGEIEKFVAPPGW